MPTLLQSSSSSLRSPPLPSTYSARLLSTIDPSTGNCRHHPAVRLCELVQGGTRWVVRRKVCYKCGSRAPGAGHRMPGRSVTNPVGRSKDDQDMPKGGRRSRSKTPTSTLRGRVEGRSSLPLPPQSRRSLSVDRHNMSNSDDDDKRKQQRGGRHVRSASEGCGDVLKGGSGNRNPADQDNFEFARVTPSSSNFGGRARSSSRRRQCSSSAHRRRPSSSSVPSPRADDNDAEGQDAAALAIVPSQVQVLWSSHSAAMNHNAQASSSREDQHRHQVNAATRTPGLGSYSRALEFTSLALSDTKKTPTPPPTISHRADHHRNNKSGCDHDDTTDEKGLGGLDESDPVIFVPVDIDNSRSRNGSVMAAPLPNPAPRTPREMARHLERIEMRRARDRYEGNKSRSRSLSRSRRMHQKEQRRSEKADEGDDTAVGPISSGTRCHSDAMELRSAAARRPSHAREHPELEGVILPIVAGTGRYRTPVDVEVEVGTRGKSVEQKRSRLERMESATERRESSSSRSRRPVTQTSFRNLAGAPAAMPTRRDLVALPSPPSSPSRTVTSAAAAAVEERRTIMTTSRHSSSSNSSGGISPTTPLPPLKTIPSYGSSTYRINISRGTSSDPLKLSTPVPTSALAASSARSARRNSNTLRTSSGRTSQGKKLRDASGRESTTSMPTRGRGAPSRGNSTSSKACGDRISSHSAKGKDGGASGGGSNDENRTIGTYLESSQSSAERALSSSNPRDCENYLVAPARAAAPSRARRGDPEKFIHKKRASRRQKEYDDDGKTVVKPMRIIDLSSDERSHASSISEGSITIKTYDFVDRRDRDGGGGAEAVRSNSRVKERALSALHSAKGGAMQIASISKTAIGGIGKTGSGRKWQSALFV
ncbi:hypothetical protein ACHAXA_000858 [Cyclostephanos tholiformis]|uniref:Uncharacterized protein n=1 Tax=Cyclostephanos tholiformis TaxID=382380 RepID=A0ABD3SR31_9STRA